MSRLRLDRSVAGVADVFRGDPREVRAIALGARAVRSVGHCVLGIIIWFEAGYWLIAIEESESVHSREIVVGLGNWLGFI